MTDGPPRFEIAYLARTELFTPDPAIGGAKLPFETYVTYGTPSKLTLADPVVQMTGGAPAPPVTDTERPRPISGVAGA